VNTTTIASLLMIASLPVRKRSPLTKTRSALCPAAGLPATGRGAPKWAIEADPTAPSAPNVLKQSGAGTLPWCVKEGTALTDRVVEVKFKPISGKDELDAQRVPLVLGYRGIGFPAYVNTPCGCSPSCRRKPSSRSGIARQD
jgi:hypothetical protein